MHHRQRYIPLARHLCLCLLGAMLSSAPAAAQAPDRCSGYDYRIKAAEDRIAQLPGQMASAERLVADIKAGTRLIGDSGPMRKEDFEEWLAYRQFTDSSFTEDQIRGCATRCRRGPRPG